MSAALCAYFSSANPYDGLEWGPTETDPSPTPVPGKGPRLLWEKGPFKKNPRAFEPNPPLHEDVANRLVSWLALDISSRRSGRRPPPIPPRRPREKWKWLGEGAGSWRIVFATIPEQTNPDTTLPRTDRRTPAIRRQRSFMSPTLLRFLPPGFSYRVLSPTSMVVQARTVKAARLGLRLSMGTPPRKPWHGLHPYYSTLPPGNRTTQPPQPLGVPPKGVAPGYRVRNEILTQEPEQYPSESDWIPDLPRAGDIEQNPGPAKQTAGEDYKLLPKWRDWAIRRLQCPTPTLDGFAETHNAQYNLFWDPSIDAFTQHWWGEHPIWMNPPFSLLPAVVRRLHSTGGHVVLICPSYSTEVPTLKRMSLRHVTFPRVPLYLWKGKTPMPAPQWFSWAFYIKRHATHGIKSPRPSQRLITEFYHQKLALGPQSGPQQPSPPKGTKSLVAPSSECLLSWCTRTGRSFRFRALSVTPPTLEDWSPTSQLPTVHFICEYCTRTFATQLIVDVLAHEGSCPGVRQSPHALFRSSAASKWNGTTFDVTVPTIPTTTLCGRGSLLTCGDVEQNPGPYAGPSSTSQIRHAMQWLETQHLLDYATIEVIDRPPAGPSGPSPQREGPGNFFDFRCDLCGYHACTRTARTIILHVSACPRLCINRSGRGSSLPSCGDIEANPGPEAAPAPWPLIPAIKPLHFLCSGRGFSLLSCGDVEANPGPKAPPASRSLFGPGRPSNAGPSARPFRCPFPDCPWEPTGSRAPLIRHLNSVHLPAQQLPDSDWLQLMDQYHCQECNLLNTAGRPCSGFRHAETARPPTNKSSHLNAPEPLGTPTVSDILSLTTPTVRHIPTGARAHCGKALGQLLKDLARDMSWEALQRLLLFPRFVLRPPKRWGSRHKRHNLAQLQSRCTSIVELPLPLLFEALSNAPRPTRKRRRPQPPGSKGETYDEILEAQLQALVTEGAIGKAAKHLLSEGLHDAASPGILDTLKSLHPQPAAPPTLPPQTEQWGDVLLDDIGERKKLLKEVITRFPPGSAPGPSGLRPRHLQDILQGDSVGASRLLEGLSLLTELCETGNLPVAAANCLCAASLIALKKPSGNRVRPIAVGETLRRVVEKFLARLPQTRECIHAMEPIQQGMGTPAACERLGRSLQQYIDGRDLPADSVILQVDLSNAFNTVDRSAVLAGVSHLTPHLLPWACLSLSTPAQLYCPIGNLKSSQGVQQGSPLGPLFFNVAIHHVITSMPADLTWNVWYMDDGTLVGSAAQIEAALSFLIPAFSTLGLQVNLQKTKLWGPGTARQHSLRPESPLYHVSHTQWEPRSGISMLGVPVHFPGDPSFLREAYTARLHTLQQSCAALIERTRDPQTQLHLLRGCFSACRFTFLTRATCSFFTKDILLQADNVIRETLEHIIGSALTDQQWLQSTLAFSQGGLGVESPHTQAPAATMSGLISWLLKGQEFRPQGCTDTPLLGTSELLHWLRSTLQPESQPVRRWAESGGILDPEIEHGEQEFWSKLIHISLRQSLLQDCQARDAVRLRSQDGTSCSAWSRAPPSSALGTKIPRDRFRIMIRWHLGMPVLSPSKAGTFATKCQLCGDALDAFGDHAVCCTKNKPWQRHFLVQDFLMRQCRSAGITCLREQSLLHSERREADLLLPNWHGTKSLAIDLTIRHPRAPGLPFADPDGVLLMAEAEKRRFASMRANAAECLFEPLVMHTWSGLPSKGTSRSLLNAIFSKIADNHMDRQLKVEEMTQGLSCIIAAQVAEQISSAVGPWEIPVLPALDIPLRVDEHGNGLTGLGNPTSDTYSELRRRTKQKLHAGPKVNGGRPTFFSTLPPTGNKAEPNGWNSHNIVSSGSPLTASAPDPVIAPQEHSPGPSAYSGTTHTNANPDTEASLTGDPEADALVRQLCDIEMSAMCSTNPWTPLGSYGLLCPDRNASFPSTEQLLAELHRALAEDHPQTPPTEQEAATPGQNAPTLYQVGALTSVPCMDDLAGTPTVSAEPPGQEPRRSQRLNPSGQKPTRKT